MAPALAAGPGATPRGREHERRGQGASREEATLQWSLFKAAVYVSVRALLVRLRSRGRRVLTRCTGVAAPRSWLRRRLVASSLRTQLLGIPPVQRTPPLADLSVPQPLWAVRVHVGRARLRRPPFLAWHELRVPSVPWSVLAVVYLREQAAPREPQKQARAHAATTRHTPASGAARHDALRLQPSQLALQCRRRRRPRQLRCRRQRLHPPAEPQSRGWYRAGA